MSQRRGRKRSRGGSAAAAQGGRPPQGVDLWKAVPLLPEPEPIRLAADSTALVRSLGAPPLPGQRAVADHYLAAVVERAAGLAVALAAAADLLEMPTDD